MNRDQKRFTISVTPELAAAEQFWAFLTGSVQSGAGFSPYVIRS